MREINYNMVVWTCRDVNEENNRIQSQVKKIRLERQIKNIMKIQILAQKAIEELENKLRTEC